MKRLIALFSILTIALIVGGIWFVTNITAAGNDKTLKRFVVEKGETANQIGIDLQKQGLIKSSIAFRIYTQVTQSAKNIKSGSYELSANLWTPQIVDKLLAGPVEVWVTVPEGLRREEVAARFVDGLGLTGSEATKFYNDFLKLTDNKEGFLFPDTYLFVKDATPGSVVNTMEANFNQKYQSVKSTQTNNLSEEEVINLASIVQREAITDSDMQLVAAILLNRKNSGMTLGSDVTLEYALGKQPDGSWWKKDLTIDDLALNSPYNTRLNVGLPPTPVSNPGLVAIKAALNPPQTDYLYYLADKDGKLHFAKTLDEHNANIAKYLQ